MKVHKIHILTLTEEDILDESVRIEGRINEGILRNLRGYKFDKVRVPISQKDKWKKSELYKYVEYCISIGGKVFAEIEYYEA